MDETVSVSSGSSGDENASSASVTYSIDSITDDRLLSFGPGDIPATITACMGTSKKCSTAKTSSANTSGRSTGTSLDGPSSSSNLENYFHTSHMKSEHEVCSPSYRYKGQVKFNATRSAQCDNIEALQGKQKKLRRNRTVFSNFQLNQLEIAFNENPYLDCLKRGELARRLKLSELQVQIWFQNKRAKERKRETALRRMSPLFPHSQLNNWKHEIPSTTPYSKGYHFPMNAFWANVYPHRISGTHPMFKQGHYTMATPNTCTSSILAQDRMRPLSIAGISSEHMIAPIPSSSDRMYPDIYLRPGLPNLSEAHAAAAETYASVTGRYSQQRSVPRQAPMQEQALDLSSSGIGNFHPNDIPQNIM